MRLRFTVLVVAFLTFVSALDVRAQVGGPTTAQFSAPTKSTAAWTSATSNNTALTVTVTNLSKVIVALHATTTMTGGSLNFEADDGSGTWWAVRATRIGGASITRQTESTFALSVVDQAWSIDVGGWTQVRVRLNPVITGSGTATVAVLPSADPSDPAVSVTLVDSAGVPITPSTDATTNTTTQTTGPQILCNASTATPTAVGADQRSIAMWCDPNGQLRVAAHAVIVASGGIASGAIASGALASGAAAAGAFSAQSFAVGAIPPAAGTLKAGSTSAMTGTTSTQVIAAQASNYLYVTSCSFSNTHASVSTMETLQDGSGGTALWTGINPFGSGSNVTFPVPLKVTTLGNGLYVANVTTGSNTFASCSGFYSTVGY